MRKIFKVVLFFALIFSLGASVAFADSCKGFATINGTKTAVSGTCFWYTDQGSVNYTTDVNAASGNGTLPDCQTMGSNSFHNSGDWGASDDTISSCTIAWGRNYKCCFQKNNQAPIAPPVPCTQDSNSNCTKVVTGLGTIQVDPAGVIGSLFGLLLGISGGIATFLLMYSGYGIITSRGDAEKLKESRDRFWAAITGLFFVALSVGILQVIGVDILHIPGLSH
ncbi:MAG TPA: hypothetical protein VFQ63_00560 [Patescibacteria group bacterium]|nr:hypothetical protein [Patescibacteria group bacterium]